MNLLSSASIFSFFTLISRILGYVRDVLIAIFLGTSILADAFFVAFRIPNTFRRLFAEGTFNAAFIPSYTSAKIEICFPTPARVNGINKCLVIQLCTGIFQVRQYLSIVRAFHQSM